jgi:hypothetical protein
MKRERRQPTPTEWKRITSARPVVRRVLERGKFTRPEPNSCSTRMREA